MSRQWNSVDIAGKKFGMLTAISKTATKQGTNAVWLCHCDCGGTKFVNTGELRKGLSGKGVRSCGCLRGRGFAIPVSESELDAISFRYGTGISVEDIAKLHGISTDKVLTELRRRGVEIRASKTATIPLQEDAFDAITPDVAYWVGFLLADVYVGHVEGKTQSTKLALAERDLGHIYKFRDFLRSGHAIQRRWNTSEFGKNRKASISIPCNHIAETLNSYGLVGGDIDRFCPNERFTRSRDFWRGVIDGDGSVLIVTRRRSHSTSFQPILQLVGNELTVNAFVAYARSVVRESRKEPRKQSSEKYLWAVRFTDRAARLLVKNLYAGATTFLDRKRAVADKIIAADFYTRKLPQQRAS